jgi:2-polyprenyl-6-methoxyphenol hydroxylase-like FAD-dependent oxidoreductase
MYVATVRLTDPPERDDTVWMYNRPGAAIAVHPGTGTPIVAFMFRSPVHVDPRDAVAARQLMRKVYADPGWRVRELLAAYLDASDTYFDAVSQVRLPAWSHGPVTLIGDAASCVSLFGEGSSAAILGAATLADALAATPQDIPAALSRYEAKHRPASRRGQRAVPVVSHLLIPASRAGITLRNQGLRLTGHR